MQNFFDRFKQNVIPIIPCRWLRVVRGQPCFDAFSFAVCSFLWFTLVWVFTLACVKMSKKKFSERGVFKCPIQKLVFSQWEDDDKHKPVINDHYFNHAVRMYAFFMPYWGDIMVQYVPT
jgi:hypothetical protein